MTERSLLAGLQWIAAFVDLNSHHGWIDEIGARLRMHRPDTIGPHRGDVLQFAGLTGRRAICTVLRPPAGSVPSYQRTSLPTCWPPPVALTSAMPAGKPSLTTTFVAGTFPGLLTVM